MKAVEIRVWYEPLRGAVALWTPPSEREKLWHRPKPSADEFGVRNEDNLMRARKLILPLLLLLTATGSHRASGQDDDPMIGGAKLSALVAEFKVAKTADDRSRLAFAIAEGKDKAKSAVPVLAAALKDPDVNVRLSVTAALRLMGPSAKAAVPGLLAALKDTDDSVRIEVMHALGQIGPDAKAAVPLVSEILKDTAAKSKLRTAAGYSLGYFGAEAKGAVPLLTGVLKDKDANVRLASATALFWMDKANAKLVVPVLRDALKDPHEQTRAEAAIRLDEIGADAKDAVPDLMAVLAAGGMPGYYARQALGKIPAAEPALVAALADPDERLQKAAASVLIEYYPEAAKKAGLGKK